jgi:RNA polymerase sigma-70 factor (ECF subfamily)
MRALGELPTQFKTVIYLADVEGYQYSDIADMMGTPLGTVMSRIHRGRQMLRAKLRPPAGRTYSSSPAPAASAATDISAATGSDAVPIAA